jgi:CheY-like chemotaxis protein
LVADDNGELREVLSEVLTLSGATCSMASSGNEAFRVFTRQRPDILISDVWMPDGDGLDLIRRIRALAPEHGGLVPAIAVSGEATGEQALMAGYHVMVPKPLDPATVVSVVEEFVRAESDTPSRANCWALSSPSPGTVVMTFRGYVSAADVRALMAAFLVHLEKRSCKVVVDLRQLTDFSVAGASVAQRAVWAKRHAIRHVRFVGGPLIARVVASAVCRLLGVGCTIESGAQGAD